MSKKTVSLVLGSGGARGLAHIGVIRWLEEHDFEIVSVSSCSIGTVIGGVYAAGKLDEFEAWMRTVTKLDIVSLMDFNWGKGGLIKGEKVMNRLGHILGDLNIEDLAIPYTAVAADISNEKEVWLQKGPLLQAIRASISLPLYLMPIELNGKTLIDGGVLNPVPIAPTFGDHSDITLAVNLAGELTYKLDGFNEVQTYISDDESEEEMPFHRKVSDYFGSLTAKTSRIDLGMYDIANQAFDAMQSTIARQKLAAYPPDITVEIARDACGTFEFERTAEMIDLGYERAEKALKHLL
ncbi:MULTISPECIES: patatin-like phospholipase family protein [unclassified Aliivibrio]|uniref:patatin-like phospholipase family protein n=1 Tax=unclassified Aliivibrio TaxID=2645654 RepID=UPI00080DB186|nr:MULTISPECIES: patatin-like phospholipase family protein [unclassified Aliivibrio]OCH12813.1 serine protease [Aliivibrio sp. 1S165]OCH16315.1 serine protease [Aliivibrio sp. 1S128]OCH28499.1 serine protease [Aliivibrio sp. 1S175]